jgi:hypothetical protein
MMKLRRRIPGEDLPFEPTLPSIRPRKLDSLRVFTARWGERQRKLDAIDVAGI